MPEFAVPETSSVEASTANSGECEFPPVSRDHILWCSYDYWFPKFRKVCIKSRIIPLPQEFIEYLREDSIVLSDEGQGDDDEDDDWEPTNPTMKHFLSEEQKQYVESYSDDEDEDARSDRGSDDDDEDNPPASVRIPPNRRFPELHQRIKDEIKALGGAVAPKLNWSSPQDAKYLLHNTMMCQTPDDIYLLFKGSSFVSHDLEHAFDGCTPDASNRQPNSGGGGGGTDTSPTSPALGFNPVLVLRSHFDIHTPLEFRCFVKHRNLVAITPRDLRYYPYMDGLRETIVARARTLFHSTLQFRFPAGNYSFDIYIPQKDEHEVGDNEDDDNESEVDEFGVREVRRRDTSRLSWARLVDINPWAPRTDTLLFTWKELLELKIPKPFLGMVGEGEAGTGTYEGDVDDVDGDDGDSDSDADSSDNDDDYVPELRIVDKDDPAASNFSSAPFSAHKLPKDVVDASMAGDGGMREFLQQWQQITARRGRR